MERKGKRILALHKSKIQVPLGWRTVDTLAAGQNAHKYLFRSLLASLWYCHSLQDSRTSRTTHPCCNVMSVAIQCGSLHPFPSAQIKLLSDVENCVQGIPLTRTAGHVKKILCHKRNQSTARFKTEDLFFLERLSGTLYHHLSISCTTFVRGKGSLRMSGRWASPLAEPSYLLHNS